MRGFTLVEIMISTLVLGLIIAGIFILLLVSDKTYHTDVALLDLQQFTRRAMEEMVEELRAGNSITIPTQPPDNSITFNTVINGLPAFGIHYFRDVAQKQLIREYPTGTFRVMASHINTLSFCWCHGATCAPGVDCDNSRGTSNLIAIQLNSTNTIRGRVINFPLKGQVKLRNE